MEAVPVFAGGGRFLTTTKAIAGYKQNVYIGGVILSFADDQTESFFKTGKSRWLPADILKRAAMRLEQLNAATDLKDLWMPPSNELEALKGNRAGQHSIRINKKWRVCFYFANGNATNVEINNHYR